MTPINGHGPKPQIEDPSFDVARAVYELQTETGDTPWDELDDDERQALADHAGMTIGAHVQWLIAKGFSLLPPGAVLRPKTDEQAAAMVQAVKLYREAQTRKGGLIGSVAPKKLIVPGAH